MVILQVDRQEHRMWSSADAECEKRLEVDCEAESFKPYVQQLETDVKEQNVERVWNEKMFTECNSRELETESSEHQILQR